MQAEPPQSGAMLDGSPLLAWLAPSTYSQTHLLLQLWGSGRCTKEPSRHAPGPRSGRRPLTLLRSGVTDVTYM